MLIINKLMENRKIILKFVYSFVLLEIVVNYYVYLCLTVIQS